MPPLSVSLISRCAGLQRFRTPDELLEPFEEPPDGRLPAEERELLPDGLLRLTDDREPPPDGRLLPTEDRELPPEERGLLTDPERGTEYRRLRLLPLGLRELEEGLRRLDLPEGLVEGRL